MLFFKPITFKSKSILSIFSTSINLLKIKPFNNIGKVYRFTRYNIKFKVV